MRRRVDVRWRLQPDDFARMQKRQLAIARKVIGPLKPGGVLVYSTCSLEPEENEEVVAQLLNEFKDLQLLEQKVITPFRERIRRRVCGKAQTHSLTERLHPGAPVESFNSYARSAVR